MKKIYCDLCKREIPEEEEFLEVEGTHSQELLDVCDSCVQEAVRYYKQVLHSTNIPTPQDSVFLGIMKIHD